MNYKDKFNAQMKKAGINSLDDLKTDAEKKAFFKAVDKSHDAKNEELLAFAEEAINEFKLKDSDVEKLKQGVKQMPPMKGAKLGKPEKVKTADEEYVEEAMKKEMAKKEMMMKAMKTGEADAEPNAEMLNAMVKDPHKSKEDKPMKDMNAMYMKSDVRADVKNNGGADMAKVKDAPKMQTAMKKINAMYKTEKYLDEKPGSIQNVVAQMQVDEMKTVTVRVKEFSQMVETYLARGGVKGFINAELTEGKQVLPLKEVRTFIDTYNRHFLTNYRAEEFIIRDRLNETQTQEGGPPVDGGPGSGGHNKKGAGSSGDGQGDYKKSSKAALALRKYKSKYSHLKNDPLKIPGASKHMPADKSKRVSMKKTPKKFGGDYYDQEDREELAHRVKFHHLGGKSFAGKPPAWQLQKYGITDDGKLKAGWKPDDQLKGG